MLRGLMRSITEEIDSILLRIDGQNDMEGVRRDLGLLILRCLMEQRDALDTWKKMQYEMAIALLPTVWLRLAVSHVRLALEPADPNRPLDPDLTTALDRLSAEDLIARVLDAMK